MKKIIAGAAAVAALAVGVTANAGCMDPRVAAQQGTTERMAPAELNQGPSARHWEGKNAGEKIVGTWYVAYTTEGGPPAAAFIQWHSDGTEWENANLPVLGGNICLGSWIALDQTHVYRNHYGWLYNNDGVLVGYFNETETDVVAWDGKSYTGFNDTKFYFYPVPPATEVTTMESKGTATARRIEP
jgi:hypothetical protein